MAYIRELDFDTRWREKDYGQGAVEDWYFTLTVTLTDDTKKTLTFWGNRVGITSDCITFGYSSSHITMVDGLLCLVQPNCFIGTSYIPFADPATRLSDPSDLAMRLEAIRLGEYPNSTTLENIVAKLRKHLVPTDRPDMYRFNFEPSTPYNPSDVHVPIYYIDLFCTCEKGACYECGVLDCGCIDQCRGRCH